MLIGGVVEDQLDDNVHAPFVGSIQEALEIVQGSVRRVDVAIVGDVVAVVAKGRWKARQQPEAGDAEFIEIV
jgi:hypothetical protein